MKVRLYPDLTAPAMREIELDFGDSPPWRVMTDEFGETWLYQYNADGVPCYETVQNHEITIGEPVFGG